MLILDSTAKRIRVVLNAAHTTNPLRMVASWRDVTTTTFTPGNTLSSSNGTTPVEVVSAPAASTQRVVDFLNVYNFDTTNKTVSISVYDGSTDFFMYVVSLGPGERVEYSEANGFVTYNSAGAIKSVSVSTNNVVSSSMSRSVLGADVTNNNAVANTIADVTGLSFAVVSGAKYWFKFYIIFTAAVTTTGSRWAINGPGSPTLLAYVSRWGVSAAGTSGTDAMTENNAVAYDSPAAANATSSATTGNIAKIEGYIQPSADGTVIARFASEISNSAIVAKAGSIVEYHQVA